MYTMLVSFLLFSFFDKITNVEIPPGPELLSWQCVGHAVQHNAASQIWSSSKPLVDGVFAQWANMGSDSIP